LESQFLFFFSALGVFNALIISVYFFFYKKPKSLSNYFFGFLLLMLAIRVGKSVFFYFNPDLSGTFLQIGISACSFIGPALYFYLKSVIKPNITKEWIYHFLFLFVGIIVIGILYPWEHYPKLWYLYIFNIVYGIWLLYLIASSFILRSTFKTLFSKTKKLSGLDFWLLSVFIGNLIIFIAYKTSEYTSYIVGALSFSFIFYLLFLLIHFNRKKISIFSPTLKYADKKIEVDEAKLLANNLEYLMESKNLYRDANLKLQDVAKELNMIPHRLSQLLNDNLNKSFTNYINSYRIDEAKKLIKNNSNFTLEAIGYECGFNSKSTFYTAFKKHSGLTPSQYKSKNK